jgi:hypothetical protein
MMFSFTIFPLFSPRTNLPRFYIFANRKTPSFIWENVVRWRASIHWCCWPTAWRHCADGTYTHTKKNMLTEALKYYWPLLRSRKGEASHSHIDRDSVKRDLPAGKYAFWICALFIQSTETNPRIQFFIKNRIFTVNQMVLLCVFTVVSLLAKFLFVVNG